MTMKQNLLKLFSVLFFTFSFWMVSGCTSVNSVEPRYSQASPEYVPDKRIITDPSLARKLQILSVNQGYASGNMLEVQVSLVSKSNLKQNFKYAFEWFDQNGMLVDNATSGWRPLRVLAKEVTTISEIAPTPRVVDFRIKFIED